MKQILLILVLLTGLVYSQPYSLYSPQPWNKVGTTINYTLGNVGIGTTSPATSLEIVGATKTSTYFQVGSTLMHSTFGIYQSNATDQRIVFSTSKTLGLHGADDKGIVYLATNNKRRLTIDSLGIITINGKTQLDSVYSIDSATAISLPAGVCGWGEIMAGDNVEFTEFRFNAAGTVTLTDNSANVINEWVTGKLCVYYDSAMKIKQTLAPTATKVSVRINYYTP